MISIKQSTGNIDLKQASGKVNFKSNTGTIKFVVKEGVPIDVFIHSLDFSDSRNSMYYSTIYR